MKFSFCSTAALCVAVVSQVPLEAEAGQPVSETKAVVSSSPFDRGMRELQMGAGGFFSLDSHGEKRPTLDDVDLDLRIGWMLSTPRGDGFFRGNCEFLLDAFGALVVDGPGDGMAGLNLLLRYNFVAPEARWVPYFQLGAGGLYNNIYKSHPQRLIGQSFEFNLQAAVGVRYLFNERVAGFVEADFRHISNADMADRNLGLNSLGGLIGVSWFF